MNSIPSGFVRIRPAPDPSTHEDPSVNRIQGSCRSVLVADVGLSLSGFSTIKSAKICPLIAVRGLYEMLYSPSSTLHFCKRPDVSGLEITCLIG